MVELVGFPPKEKSTSMSPALGAEESVGRERGGAGSRIARRLS